MTRRSGFPLILTIFCFGILSVSAEDWPQFGRDSTRNPVSPEKNPPIWWQFAGGEGEKKVEDKNIKWKAKLGERTNYNYSDPIIQDGMIWIGTKRVNPTKSKPTEAEFDMALVCLDEATGKELFCYQYEPIKGQVGFWANTPSSSPLIIGDHLWFMNNRAEVFCWDIKPLKDRKGKPKELWKLDLAKEFKVKHWFNHHGSRRPSIAAHGDYLYLPTGHHFNTRETLNIDGKNAPSLLCIEKMTGKVVWKDSSPNEEMVTHQPASATIIEIKGEVQVVVPQGDGWIRSFEPKTGKLIWKFDTNPVAAVWLDKENPRNGICASAVFANGLIYVANADRLECFTTPAYLYCIDPTKKGDLTPTFTTGDNKGKKNPNSGMVWMYGGPSKDPKEDSILEGVFGNPVVMEGFVVVASFYGGVHCLDAKTGKAHWAHRYERKKKNPDGIHGSPLIVDGKIYISSRSEGVWIYELSKEMKILGSQVGFSEALENYESCVSPVFANGVLYIESDHVLYAIKGNEKPPEPKKK